jgi:hypothetical protein
MDCLVRHKVISLEKNGSLLPRNETLKDVGTMKEVVYFASEFNYFACNEQMRFLAYAEWTKESGVLDRIHYRSKVQFENTFEDVSALYGEALVYMLQWEHQKFCPNVETVVYDGILRLKKFAYYGERRLLDAFKRLNCEPLSEQDMISLRNKFLKAPTNNSIKGIDLVPLLNSGFIQLRKKRCTENKTIYFAVRAVMSLEDDEHMSIFTKQIKAIYESPEKSPSKWIYLANGVMAFHQYHEKWNQIGTDAVSYESWVEPNALFVGLRRLSMLMENVPISNEHRSECIGCFELPTFYRFSNSKKCFKTQTEVIGVMGICDWMGQGLFAENGTEVDFLEVKFVHELSNDNRLQVMVNCALLSLANHRSTMGMLFNARTGEKEICSLDYSKANKFLSEMTQFKLNGAIEEEIEAQLPLNVTSMRRGNKRLKLSVSNDILCVHSDMLDMVIN